MPNFATLRSASALPYLVATREDALATSHAVAPFPRPERRCRDRDTLRNLPDGPQEQLTMKASHSNIVKPSPSR